MALVIGLDHGLKSNVITLLYGATCLHLKEANR